MPYYGRDYEAYARVFGISVDAVDAHLAAQIRPAVNMDDGAKAEGGWGLSMASRPEVLAEQKRQMERYRSAMEALQKATPPLRVLEEIADPLKKAEAAIQTAVAEQIGLQTAQHLSALDAALGKAVEDITKDNRWEARKSNQGGMYLSAGMVYFHSFNSEFIEAIAAFMSGDLLTALQKREEVIGNIPVAP